MRKEEIKLLNQPYDSPKNEIDRRFNYVIEADLPSAKKLVKEIFDDFDLNSFGIYWWNKLQTEERILISDYLLQCANGIEENLVEAKLHYFEWLEANENHNKQIEDIVSRDNHGRLVHKMRKAKSPIDDLPFKLEKLHICGFFRAIGSSLDCLSAVIIGVLGLPCKKSSLRRSSIKMTQQILSNVEDSGTDGAKLQIEFSDFFEKVKSSSGPKDWLEWADQYRNMFVHRGRRMMFSQTRAKETMLYDSDGLIIPRSKSTTHLAKFPDRSDVEAFIKSEEVILNEDAEKTLSGIFQSSRELNETICERLLEIWKDRRNNPKLIEQPQDQWDDNIKNCDFTGYDSTASKIDMKTRSGHPNLLKRMRSASVFGSQRRFWDKSKWS